MRLEHANTSQEAELREFYEQFSMKSLVEFKVRRPTDFFAPYRAQSENFETLVLRDKDESLQGMASFIYRETLYNDRIQKIAVATDLRIPISRKAILEWSHHFLPVLRDIIKTRGVSSVFSTINTNDPVAINAFVRPRTIKRPLPRYHLYRKFQMVTLHGRFPWAPPPVPTLRIRPGETKWIGPMIDYIKRRAPYRAFCSVWDEKSFYEKLYRLPNFKLEDFWLAFDAQDRVVGMLAPWSPLRVQEYCPVSYGLRAHNFRQFLKFGRLLGWTRPLTKPFTRTGSDLPLKFRYLTFLSVENEDIFESLLWTAFEALPKDEFLAYAHSNVDFRLNPPRSWVSAGLPFGLYAVLPPEMDPPSFLHPTQTLNPDIETCTFF